MNDTRSPTHYVTAAAFSAVLLLAACSQQPQNDVQVKPASSATTGPASAPADTVAIFFAQIGNKLGDNNLLVESLSEVGRSDDIYAMAVFKGESQTQTAGVTVTAADGKEIFSESKEFTPNGETPVVFQIKPAVEVKPGDYKAIFTLNGGPCWEINFKVI